ncbi:aldo/keto reductase [Candidatus Woesearchaeota archaeon]|nr:aldo/keto reductase [Candidatus Woesearchaeota archaeon]
MRSIKLSSNYEMPVLGLGTWQLKGKSCKDAVKTAIKLGYTHIDTADAYDNHVDVGKGIKESKIERSKLFITTKVWTTELYHKDILKNTQRFLEELQIDYIDLLLIHWPNKAIQMEEPFRAFKELIESKKVRSIGISNFTISHIKEAKKISKVPISINQVEYHPYLNQEELLQYCKENNIVITAYSPLARGRILEDSTLKEIAKKYNKTISQVVLRWLIQKGLIVIPKASSESHIKENLEIFDFELKKEDMNKINSLDKNQRFVNPGFAEF